MNFNNIPFNYKFTIVMGVIGAVLSLLVGLLFGISVDSLLLRSAIFLIIFSGLGFIAIYVVEKYVPELYSVFVSDSSGNLDDEDIDASIDGEDLEDNVSEMSMDDEQGEDFSSGSEIKDGGTEEVFKEMGKEDFPDVEGTPAQGMNVSAGKLGKHVIKDEMSNYEPKLMAEAIRTMISKDD